MARVARLLWMRFRKDLFERIAVQIAGAFFNVSQPTMHRQHAFELDQSAVVLRDVVTGTLEISQSALKRGCRTVDDELQRFAAQRRRHGLGAVPGGQTGGVRAVAERD